jgi:hypothetical protein
MVMPSTAQKLNYDEADSYLRSLATGIETARSLFINAIVVFEDAYVWNSTIVLAFKDRVANNFLQRAIQSEWEFNAGVRPEWWPSGLESDRMWEVHCREDRHNGRTDLARARLDRYDLQPIIRSILPARDTYDL